MCLEKVPPTNIRDFILSTGKQVFALSGYADTGYQEPDLMLAAVRQALSNRDPGQWIVQIGATQGGVGAAYTVAKELGFTTLGIVSWLALEEHIKLSDSVDYVFFVEDACWGGRTDRHRLSPTSVAYVENGDEFLVIGGYAIAKDEILAAHEAGKPVQFIPADMNHEIARTGKVLKVPLSPNDYKGLAHDTLIKIGS